jgi:phosphoglycolate phosphatase-like HAD superfamily hydrolase
MNAFDVSAYGRRVPGTEIILVSDLAIEKAPKFALFDSDGTISTLRQGWEEVMAPVMVGMICGETEPTEAIRREVDQYINESTGINTILQMEHLVEMVEAHGLVTDDKVLDLAGYKRIYNDRLMVSVAERLAKLTARQLRPIDYTITGALHFLAKLAGQLEMRIFSGTDEHDVVNELTALGVAQLFARIHGALARFEDSNKEQILRDLMTQSKLAGPEVVVVGDGPVEIRVAKQFGCIAIGVASDEVARYGWNPVKVERLVKAQADILIPDFSCGADLLNLLCLLPA